MSVPEAEKYTYRYLGHEHGGKLTRTVTDRIPMDKKPGYSRQVVGQDKDELRAWKLEYYNRKNEHLKTLILTNYELCLDRGRYASEMTMVKHLTGESTVSTLTDYQFGADLDD